MKHFIFLLLVVILFSCNIKDNNRGLKNDAKEFKVELTPWLEFYKKYNINLDNFVFSKEDSLPNLDFKVDTFDIKNDIYKPFYKYSTDSSKILDFVSYNLILELDDRDRLIYFGGGVDCEVSIKNLEDNIHQRILFLGPQYIVEDGYWLSDNELLIVGQYLNADNENIKPMIWFVSINNNIIKTFEYNQGIKNMKSDYIEIEKFKKSNIRMYK